MYRAAGGPLATGKHGSLAKVKRELQALVDDAILAEHVFYKEQDMAFTPWGQPMMAQCKGLKPGPRLAQALGD